MDLKFINFNLIDEDSLDGLSEFQKKQLLAAGKGCFEGPDDDYIKDVYAVLGETYEGNCEFWQVISIEDENKPLYDVYIFNVDTAIVFHSNTIKDTGVGMIQYDFDPIYEETKENRTLADALQKAFNEKPTVDYLDPNTPAGAYQKALKDVKKD